MDDRTWFTSMQHAQRRGFALKRFTFQCIRSGDVQGMAALFAPRENLTTISGALSDDLEHAVLACLFTWAQAEQVAVAEGVSEEEGSALFYVYARKAHEVQDVGSLLELDRQVLIDFASAVDDVHREQERRGPVNEGIRFIDEQLYNGVTAQRTADHLHFSVDYLSKLFRDVTGVTLAAYIRSRKIEDAMDLLENSPLEIMEIGRRLGFGSHSHFSSVFRKLVGMTPRGYRRMAMERRLEPDTPREQGAAMVSRLAI